MTVLYILWLSAIFLFFGFIGLNSLGDYYYRYVKHINSKLNRLKLYIGIALYSYLMVIILISIIYTFFKG